MSRHGQSEVPQIDPESFTARARERAINERFADLSLREKYKLFADGDLCRFERDAHTHMSGFITDMYCLMRKHEIGVYAEGVRPQSVIMGQDRPTPDAYKKWSP